MRVLQRVQPAFSGVRGRGRANAANAGMSRICATLDAALQSGLQISDLSTHKPITPKTTRASYREEA